MKKEKTMEIFRVEKSAESKRKKISKEKTKEAHNGRSKGGKGERKD